MLNCFWSSYLCILDLKHFWIFVSIRTYLEEINFAWNHEHKIWIQAEDVTDIVIHVSSDVALICVYKISRLHVFIIFASVIV